MPGIPFLRLEHVFYILHCIADCVHSAVCVPAQVAVVLHHLATYRCYGNTGHNACADSFDKAHRFLIHHIRPPNCIPFFQ